MQETTQPEGSSGTYAILQDGRLIGVVRRYQASALGRRAGPFADDYTLPGDARPARMAGIVGILRSRLDFVNAVQDQLQATRCPYARQMMLAQMQAAAAAQALQQDGFEGENDGMMEPHHHHMMFGGPEGLPRKQRAEGIPRGPHHGPFHGPHGPFPEVMHEHFAEGMAHKGPHFAEHTREPHMGPHEMPAERPMNFGHGPLFVRSRDAAEAGPGARLLTRPMLLMRGPDGGWAELENTAEPGECSTQPCGLLHTAALFARFVGSRGVALEGWQLVVQAGPHKASLAAAVVMVQLPALHPLLLRSVLKSSKPFDIV